MEGIKTSSEGDIVREGTTGNNKLDHWYGNYFFASGVQEVSIQPVADVAFFLLTRSLASKDLPLSIASCIIKNCRN
jgi:hypothetical protein